MPKGRDSEKGHTKKVDYRLPCKVYLFTLLLVRIHRPLSHSIGLCPIEMGQNKDKCSSFFYENLNKVIQKTNLHKLSFSNELGQSVWYAIGIAANVPKQRQSSAAKSLCTNVGFTLIPTFPRRDVGGMRSRGFCVQSRSARSHRPQICFRWACPLLQPGLCCCTTTLYFMTVVNVPSLIDRSLLCTTSDAGTLGSNAVIAHMVVYTEYENIIILKETNI